MAAAAAAFYFDLASPEAYLAAERVLPAFAGPCEWRPILASALPHAEGFEGFRCAEERTIYLDEVARRAARHGLQPLRPPDLFPFDSRIAMLAATYAKAIGRAVAFAQAAFRQAFAGGRTLAEIDNVLIAASACEMHPAAVLKAIDSRTVAAQLDAETERARTLGVADVPAFLVGERVFDGEGHVEEAAAAAARAAA